MNKPITHLHVNMASHVGFARSDITSFIELKIPLPIMFRSLDMLEKSMLEAGMEKKELEGINSNEALLFVGNYKCNNNLKLPLEALWVRAKSPKYRKAFKYKHLSANNSQAPTDLHADHILNRASLKELYKKHDPWVMLFETPRSANCGSGAKIEKWLPKIPANVEQVFLEPLHVFKLFATDMPVYMVDFLEVMNSIDGQLSDKNFVAQIKTEVLNKCKFK